MKALRAKAGLSVRSHAGLRSCGDAATVIQEPSSRLFCVVDALGHGPDAEQSANQVIATVKANAGRPLAEIFAACDAALDGMRGVVMSVLRQRGQEMTFAGIGNVEIHGPKGVSRPVCVPGVVGRGASRTVCEYPVPVARRVIDGCWLQMACARVMWRRCLSR